MTPSGLPTPPQFLLRIILILVLILTTLPTYKSLPSHHDDHYAFSLSTFNPQGRLLQVEYAAKSASLSVPLVGYLTSTTCVLTRPLSVPSPDLRPTYPRVFKLTSKTMTSYTGIPSDFAHLTHSVSSSVLQWRSEYGEEMPVNVVAFEVAKFMQGHTMKPGVRPLGLCVLVGGLDVSGSPRLFQINSAGDVTEGTAFVVGGANFNAEDVKRATNTVEGGDMGEGGRGEGEDGYKEVVEFLKRAMEKRGERMENEGGGKGTCEHFVKGRVGKDGFTHIVIPI